jgi:predicted nucleic acid-binding protein
VNHLLDTCALCDPAYPKPNAGLRKWYAANPEAGMYVSVLSIGEIRKGLVRLGDSKKAARIGAWLDHDLMLRFDQRLLPVDVEICNRWGTMCAELLRRGRPTPVMDGLIAATAKVHGLALVTRNVKDFSAFDIQLINPWQ